MTLSGSLRPHSPDSANPSTIKMLLSWARYGIRGFLGAGASWSSGRMQPEVGFACLFEPVSSCVKRTSRGEVSTYPWGSHEHGLPSPTQPPRGPLSPGSSRQHGSSTSGLGGMQVSVQSFRAFHTLGPGWRLPCEQGPFLWSWGYWPLCCSQDS